MRTRSATCPDRATAQWCTQQVVTRNEQAVHRWPAQGTRPRPPGRPVGSPSGACCCKAMMLAGREPVDVRAARVTLRREASSPHGFVVHATYPIYL